MKAPAWWKGDPTVMPCPLCQAPIQRTHDGTLHDGLSKHYKQVHPNRQPPAAPTATSETT